MLFDIVLLRKQRTGVGPSDAASVEKDRRESQGGCRLQYARKPSVLHPRGHGSARRDPLRDKIREVGRGLSLETHRRAAMGGFTQDDGYVRGVAADAQLLLRILVDFQQRLRLLLFGGDASQRHTGIGIRDLVIRRIAFWKHLDLPKSQGRSQGRIRRIACASATTPRT